LKLHAMEWPVGDDSIVWVRAVQLAPDKKQHIFDTHYHTVALEHESAILVTADERDLIHAAAHGRVLLLRNWR